MSLEELMQLYVQYITNITFDKFWNIVSHSNGVQGYSFDNRLLIYNQNNEATNVKSHLLWKMEGCNVNKDARPIFIALPILKSVYKDKSGRQLNKYDLSPNELIKALEIGIVIKEEQATSLKYAIVWDVSNVEKIDKSRKLLELDRIIVPKRLESLFYHSGIKSYHPISGAHSLEKAIIDYSDEIIGYWINKSNLTNLNGPDKILAKFYLEYALITYYNINGSPTNEQINEIEHILNNKALKNKDLITLLNIIEDLITQNIVKYLPLQYGQSEVSASIGQRKEHIIKKADTLLCMLEANYINRELEK